MKLQHNSSGESSEDLIALIIAVQRERGEGKHEEEEEESERREAEEEKAGKDEGVMWQSVSQMLQV